MFDIDQLIADCQAARDETEPRLAIREVLGRALTNPDDIGRALAPTEGGLTLLHHADDLTLIHVVWAPGMTIRPHDHRMWAAIGIYAGQEDNTFYRRSGPGGNTLVESGGKQVATGDVLVLGDDAIHSVTNPLRTLTAAFHVYGGDFVDAPRSQWDLDLAGERPYDMVAANEQFAEANAAWHAARSSG
jgi:predicted metal-dependent enzyme (double-stranded beta helix superfamily)